MSTRRRTLGVWASPTPLGPNGERLCRNCHGPMPEDKRKHNCSPKCVEEWRFKTSPQIMRHRVFDRDQGICAECGHDTLKEWMEKYSITKIHAPRGEWQADHIIPVIEGGGECGLENYRTLCIPCHQKVTKELAGRLAAKKAAEKLAPLTRPLVFGDAAQIEARKFAKRRKSITRDIAVEARTRA